MSNCGMTSAQEWPEPAPPQPCRNITVRGPVPITRYAMLTPSVVSMCTHGAFMDRLQSIKTPTLVVAGEHDPILSPAILRETVVSPISGARMVVLDCAHEIPLEQPHTLAAL